MLEIILVQGFSLLKIKITQFVECKESQFTACHSGKLKLAFY